MGIKNAISLQAFYVDAKNGALKLVNESPLWNGLDLILIISYAWHLWPISKSGKCQNVFCEQVQLSKYGPMPFFIEMTSACTIYYIFLSFFIVNPKTFQYMLVLNWNIQQLSAHESSWMAMVMSWAYFSLVFWTCVPYWNEGPGCYIRESIPLHLETTLKES